MAEVKRMTIHRALTELKNLKDRIHKATSEVNVIVPNRKSNEKIGGVEVEEYKKQMQASYDKVIGLINYRNRLKTAVVQSNAKTIVTVAGEEMSVAQAIERKDSVHYEEGLFHTIQNQYRLAVAKVASENDKLPEKLETYLVNILGGKEKQTNKEEVEMHTKTFMNRNEYELVEPFNTVQIVEKLESYINEFKNEVDAVLSESNATTFIEVEV
ncbi:hypothetical protein SAMN05880501_1246 [Ureibacillus xyleni]|uniref:Uncharacterized protein n=1 Tax=Ureibacillus xyleni TaxID=614648 RepID=A0A285TUL3_9BACL|nr:hypothetical protein [Ureibacillus xyleni]SOC27586.1 hypothetical protein SAMN05880501_1246 [Ureibacillus xyleni]